LVPGTGSSGTVSRVNEYSARWRAIFGEPDASRTAADVAFLRRVVPLPGFRRVLDVPCGSGRHKRALEALGYEVVGVDNDPVVSPDVVADMRELGGLPSDFDAVLNLWASFGWFDEAENARVFDGLAARLRPGGRLVLDLYNRAFFEGRVGEERELAAGVVERSAVLGNRRRVELRYPDGAVECFEWQLFSVEELRGLGAGAGLNLLEAVAAPHAAAMQLVFERGLQHPSRFATMPAGSVGVPCALPRPSVCIRPRSSCPGTETPKGDPFSACRPSTS
jgi:SAM-dependent methyltransferase